MISRLASRSIILGTLVLFTNLKSQDLDSLFTSPLDIPLYLSGNFAELRNNHFHTGIDIKTQGVEGQNVLAVADGFVSRISISPYGYGNAIYIEHPNGYTTLYGHLQKFSPEISEVVREKQYQSSSFRVDFVPKEKIEVKRGEIIATSGNSGSSGGPHLHFEIRRTSDSHALNPLKFGFAIKDDIPPRIRGVRFHPLSDSTLIDGKNEAKSFVVHGSNGKYRLKTTEAINVYGAFGISIHALDYLNGYPNKCGLYKVYLEVDEEKICAQQFDELDFATIGHINSYKAYDVYRRNRWHYHKSFVEPGNDLEIYTEAMNGNGILFFPDTDTHRANYKVTDAYGNRSSLSFEFTSISKPTTIKEGTKPYDAYFKFDQPNEFTYNDELMVSLPENSLYTDLKFSLGREEPKQGQYSARFSVQNELVPLKKPMNITLSASNVPDSLKNKIVIARYASTGGASYLEAERNENHFQGKSKQFGKFVLEADTNAPDITVVQVPKAFSVGSKIVVRVKDDKTGISKFESKLNGNWILTEYEPKKRTLTIRISDRDKLVDLNQLEIAVSDLVGNTAEKRIIR